VLQSSSFSDPESGDTHISSEWQITSVAGDYSSPVFTSGTDAGQLTDISIPAGVLQYSTTYYWHVRHCDSRGLWSSWSRETAFTTTAQGTPPEEDGKNATPPPSTDLSHGIPFGAWIVVGVAAVLVVGAGAYLVISRRPATR